MVCSCCPLQAASSVHSPAFPPSQTFCPVHVPAECANTTAAAQQPGQPAAGSQLAAAAAAAQPQPASGQQAAGPAGTGAATGWRAGRPDPGWAPLLGERQISKGILTYGDTARTRRLAAKLLRGEPITAAVVGGSITWGHVSRGVERVFESLRGKGMP